MIAVRNPAGHAGLNARNQFRPGYFVTLFQVTVKSVDPKKYIMHLETTCIWLDLAVGASAVSNVSSGPCMNLPPASTPQVAPRVY